MRKALLAPMTLTALVGSIDAQNFTRQAEFIGKMEIDRGRCTIEVVVDGAAEIQIHRTTGTMRQLQGQRPQWRQFQCTSAMPNNPGNFRFEGVGGRGSQELIRDPRDGGTAVVRITDPSEGAEAYSFDLVWDNSFPDQTGRFFDRRDSEAQFREPQLQDGPPFDRQPGGRFTTDQAIRVCQDAISREAQERFGNAAFAFRQTRVDDNPDRNDWVVGTIVITRSRYRRNEVYRFSCSVNFDTGSLRTAHIGVPDF